MNPYQVYEPLTLSGFTSSVRKNQDPDALALGVHVPF